LTLPLKILHEIQKLHQGAKHASDCEDIEQPWYEFDMRGRTERMTRK
jgi:hypothetical protein